MWWLLHSWWFSDRVVGFTRKEITEEKVSSCLVGRIVFGVLVAGGDCSSNDGTKLVVENSLPWRLMLGR